MHLIKQLVSNPGVSEAQTKGEAGSLFRLTQDKLNSDQFALIADKVSGLDDTVSASPNTAD